MVKNKHFWVRALLPSALIYYLDRGGTWRAGARPGYSFPSKHIAREALHKAPFLEGAQVCITDATDLFLQK